MSKSKRIKYCSVDHCQNKFIYKRRD